VIEGWRIKDQPLILSSPSGAGLSDAVSRVANDRYRSSMAVFREGDTLVDIGAHVGVMSIYLAKRYPFIKVYAVEPDPINYACLIRNIELNEVTNVTAIDTLMCGDPGQKTLYVDASDSAWATTDAGLACARGPLRVAQVASMTLGELFDKHGIRHCRLLKLTAPGNVLDILTGFNRSGCVDLLCGEAVVDDGGRAKLEAASWSVARQHFWRIQDRQGADRQGASRQGASRQGASRQGASRQGASRQGASRQGASRQGAAKSVPWIHQLPTGCEDSPSESKTPMRASLDSPRA
jgi:FkbM family methyltransferase